MCLFTNSPAWRRVLPGCYLALQFPCSSWSWGLMFPGCQRVPHAEEGLMLLCVVEMGCLIESKIPMQTEGSVLMHVRVRTFLGPNSPTQWKKMLRDLPGDRKLLKYVFRIWIPLDCNRLLWQKWQLQFIPGREPWMSPADWGLYWLPQVLLLIQPVTIYSGICFSYMGCAPEELAQELGGICCEEPAGCSKMARLWLRTWSGILRSDLMDGVSRWKCFPWAPCIPLSCDSGRESVQSWTWGSWDVSLKLLVLKVRHGLSWLAKLRPWRAYCANTCRLSLSLLGIVWSDSFRSLRSLSANYSTALRESFNCLVTFYQQAQPR